jgi:SAM-dependent methyltransferase
MTGAAAGMRGSTPEPLIQPAPPKNKFQAIYENAYEGNKYRGVSPGERDLANFIEAANPQPGTTVVDWGCGTGRAGYKLWTDYEMDVTLVDFAKNSLDEHIKEASMHEKGIRFVQQDITEKCVLPSQFGICVDVMEHIPEEDVDAVLSNILDNSRQAYFQIAMFHDTCGDHDEIQEDLHVCVHGYHWWLRKLVDQHVLIHRSAADDHYCYFYVTGWASRIHITDGKINTDKETIISHIKENAKLELPNVRPHQPQDTTVMLLGGGPSLNDFTDEIIEQRKAGMPMITMNGTYNWAIEHGLEPSMQLVIDAREFNTRFVEPILPKTKYCVASQAHPDIAKACPPDRTMIWQVSTDPEYLDVIKECYGETLQDWFPCPGGSTVMLRGIALMRMLGYHKFIIYGFDSCLREEDEELTHHSYEQEENDGAPVIPIVVGRNTKWEKTFRGNPWMWFQAKEFTLMIPRILMDCKIQVKGDGMIAYMLESGAELAAFETQEQVGQITDLQRQEQEER